jgi:hypothetical protein
LALKAINMEKYFKKGSVYILLTLLFACNSAATISSRNIYFDDISTKNEISDQDFNSIDRILFAFINSLHQKKPNSLLRLISMEDGIYIDLKAHLSYNEFNQQLTNKNSYVMKLFFTGSRENGIQIKPIREILQNQNIVYDIFFYSKAECEIYLETEQGEKLFELTPPILRKKKGRWYLTRSF